MPRGITQDQVDAAADAILGAGSPNTVTRMLDAWRSQLATDYAS